MRIAGIDYSLTCPSICVYDTSDVFSFNSVLFFVCQQNVTKWEFQRRNSVPVPNITFHESQFFGSDIMRYESLAKWALGVLLQEHVSEVSLEGYALGAKGRIFNIAEATGLLKYLIYTNGIGLEIYSPAQNKKSFSGKGNANKAHMIETFNQKQGIRISELLGYKTEFTASPVSDIVDSFALLETYLKEHNYGL